MSFVLPDEVDGEVGRCIRVFYLKADSDSKIGLESDNNVKAWIDTGVVPTANTSIRIEYRQRTDNMVLFGVAEQFFFFQMSDTTSYWMLLGGSAAQTSTGLRKTNDGNVHTFKFGKDGVVIDDSGMDVAIPEEENVRLVSPCCSLVAPRGLKILLY